MSNPIGKKIREIREAEGMSRSEFESLTGIPEGTQKLYETGRRTNIGSETLTKITRHERFKKYTMWLMNDDTDEVSGQIAPALSPSGQESTSFRLKGKAAG
ncbi:XRE family transcriptional regulator [Enterobacteriaceae bacterium ML5]|nr:XRE family transcriptional regulator [Enterobacteriaceae bacterium ML5]